MSSYIKRLVKAVFFFFKWRGKLRFSITCNISLSSTFEGANKIYPHTVFHGSLGYGSYIAGNCIIYANIGRYTSIAPYVRTNVGVHPYRAPFVSTSPMFFSTIKQNGQTFATKQMFNEIRNLPVIGNDCWIGENSFLCGGITIGDGAVVLAGSVVTKDVPPYSIVGGVPAVIRGFRYDEDTIRFLLDLCWWNKDIQWLQKNWELLCNIDELKRYSQEENMQERN